MLSPGSRLFQGLREQRHGVGDAPGQDVRLPQGRSQPGEKGQEVRILTDAHGLFEPGKGPRQVTLAQRQQTNPPIGAHNARGLLHRLGNPEPFFPEGTTLGEHAELGMTHSEPGTGAYSGQDDLAEVLVAPCPLERCQSLPEAVDRPTRVTLGLVGLTKVEVRQRVQDDVIASHGECEGALAGGDGLVISAHKAEME